MNLLYWGIATTAAFAILFKAACWLSNRRVRGEYETQRGRWLREVGIGVKVALAVLAVVACIATYFDIKEKRRTWAASTFTATATVTNIESTESFRRASRRRQRRKVYYTNTIEFVDHNGTTRKGTLMGAGYRVGQELAIRYWPNPAGDYSSSETVREDRGPQ